MVAVSAASLVNAVKAVEQVLTLRARQRCALVCDRQHGVTALLAERYLHRAALGMAHGVIEQYRHELLEFAAVTLDKNVRRKVALESQPLFKRHAFKRQRLAGCKAAEVNSLGLQGGAFGPRKLQKLRDKLAHALIFVADIRKPPIFADLTGKQLGVCAHDRDRRFQLVSGVGDKALLLLEAVLERAHNALCDVHRQEEEHDNRRRSEDERVAQKSGGVFVYHGVVHEGHERVAVLVGTVICKAAARAVVPAVGRDIERKLLKLGVRVHRRRLVYRLEHRARFVHGDRVEV